MIEDLSQGPCQGRGAAQGDEYCPWQHAIANVYFNFGSSYISLVLPHDKFVLCCCMHGRSYDSSDVDNPGNNLYVTGLSSRVTTRDLEKHFSSEGGKVVYLLSHMLLTFIIYYYFSLLHRIFGIIASVFKWPWWLDKSMVFDKCFSPIFASSFSSYH